MEKGAIDAKEVLHELYSYRKRCIQYKRYLMTERKKVHVDIRIRDKTSESMEVKDNGKESTRGN